MNSTYESVRNQPDWLQFVPGGKHCVTVLDAVGLGLRFVIVEDACARRSKAMYKRWSDHDIVALRSLAGKLPAAKIAAQIGRSVGATAIKAHQLKLSLKTRPDPRSQYPEPGPAGMNFR